MTRLSGVLLNSFIPDAVRMQTGRGVRAIQRVTEPIKVTKIGVLQPVCVPRLAYGLCTYRSVKIGGQSVVDATDH